LALEVGATDHQGAREPFRAAGTIGISR
jgi:hypothetical protein